MAQQSEVKKNIVTKTEIISYPLTLKPIRKSHKNKEHEYERPWVWKGRGNVYTIHKQQYVHNTQAKMKSQ